MLQFNPKKDNLKAVSAIMDILTACGCAPTVKKTDDGNAIVKVNAPTVNKKYLISIKTPRGACASIGYYADTPEKNYRVYYCGSDTGERFEYIGNAARYLEKLAQEWSKNGIANIEFYHGARDDIPRRGSNA